MFHFLSGFASLADVSTSRAASCQPLLTEAARLEAVAKTRNAAHAKVANDRAKQLRAIAAQCMAGEAVNTTLQGKSFAVSAAPVEQDPVPGTTPPDGGVVQITPGIPPIIDPTTGQPTQNQFSQTPLSSGFPWGKVLLGTAVVVGGIYLFKRYKRKEG